MNTLEIIGLISSLLGFVFSSFFFFFGLIEWRVKKHNPLPFFLNSFFFTGSSMAAFGQTMLYITKNPSVSLFWEQFQHIGLFILMPAWSHFIYNFFLKKRINIHLLLIYTVSIFSIVATYWGNLLFIQKPTPFKGSFTHTFGPLYSPVLIFLLINILYLFFKTLLKLIKEKKVKQEEIFFIIGTGMAMLTGIKDLLETWVRTPICQIFPYGLILTSISNFIILIIYIKDMDREYEHQREMKQELIIAQKIQKDMVPPVLNIRTRFYEITAINKPGEYIGGDFYNFYQPDNKNLFFIIGDVCGKGISAALYMTFILNHFKYIIQSNRKISIEKILSIKWFYSEHQIYREMFATIFLGYADFINKKLHFINAGHLDIPFISKGKINFLKSNNPAVGIESGYNYKSNVINFYPDDILFLYTDGFIEPNEVSEKVKNEIFTTVKKATKSQPSVILDRLMMIQKEEDTKAQIRDDLSAAIIVFKKG